MLSNLIWKPLKYPMIPEGYLISNTGFIRNKDCDESDYLTADYHSSNGYDYILLIVKEEYRVNNSIFMLFPIDELLASAFIYIPEELTNKRITVKHIDGDTRNIELTNLEWIEDAEEWRECTYPGVKPGMYEVSSWGRVRNKKTNIFLNVYIDHKGYSAVQLMTVYGKSRPIVIHRIIANQFIRQIERTDIINHINGIKYISIPKNIEYVTQYQNVKHARDTGLINHAYGESVNTAKLNKETVIKICELLQESNGSIDYVIQHLKKNIDRKLIYRILIGETWKSISKHFVFNYTSRKLSKDEVILICKILIEVDGNIDDAYNIITTKNINITKHLLSLIKGGRSYENITKSILCNRFRTRLTTEDVIDICESLLKHNMNIDDVLHDLKDNPRINLSRIRHILHKESHSDISDKYF